MGGVLLLSFPFFGDWWGENDVLQVGLLFPDPWVHFKMGERLHHVYQEEQVVLVVDVSYQLCFHVRQAIQVVCLVA